MKKIYGFLLASALFFSIPCHARHQTKQTKLSTSSNTKKNSSKKKDSRNQPKKENIQSLLKAVRKKGFFIQQTSFDVCNCVKDKFSSSIISSFQLPQDNNNLRTFYERRDLEDYSYEIEGSDLNKLWITITFPEKRNIQSFTCDLDDHSSNILTGTEISKNKNKALIILRNASKWREGILSFSAFFDD